MKKLIFGFVAMISFLSVGSAYAESNLRRYGAGRFDFEIGVDYFKSAANFQSDATKSALPSGNYLQSINVVSEARYVLFDSLALSVGAAVNSVETNDNLSKRANSSLSHIYIGGDYHLMNRESWEMFFEASYSQAMEKVDVAADSALNSDGANEIKAAVGGLLKWGYLVPFGKVGLNYRTEGLSTLMTYTAGMEIKFESFAFGGLVNGSMTVKDDDKTNQAFERDILTGRVNAGSKKYYSVNPNLTDSEIYAKFSFDNNLSAKVFGGYTIIGSNTAEGFHGGAAISWGFGGSPGPTQEFIFSDSPKKPSRNQLKKPKPIAVDPSEQGFKEDVNDGVNQDYFKPVMPKKDDYIEKLESAPENQDPESPPPPPVAKPKAKIKPVLDPAVEKEYKIKLKKKKKKKST